MDKKQKKRLKRAAKKKNKNKQDKEVQERITKKMHLFERLPAQCSACNKVFPKTQEAHMSWRVVVRNEEQQVRLFCPECQEKAKELVEKNNEV